MEVALEAFKPLHTRRVGHPVIETELVGEEVAFVVDGKLASEGSKGYQVLASAAIVTVPPRIRAVLGLKPRPGARHVGLASTGAMRWALASSPRWRQALLRVGAPIDERRFKQKAPFETLEAA